jgi:hypothetical protein
MIVNNDMTVESLANMFQASERNDSFSISLSALSSLADEVKALTWDQKLAAVPSIRHEKIEELHRSVDTVAQCIGTEEFYLKVGGTFYTKRADVGLRPDGFVSKNTAERIEANRKIEEELRDINFRSRQVLNTAAISEFGNMMGKINQLRAEVAKQAAINHLSPDDVDRLDRDVQEFLNDPDVKDSLDKLERAEEKLNAVTVQLAELEVDSENVSPSTVEGNELSSGIEETTPHDSTAEREAQMALPPEYIALEANRDSLVHEVFQQVTAFRQRYEEFAANHPHLMKIGGLALKGIGYVSLGGLIKAGVKLGGKKMLALFGSQVLSQELIASVIENGTDALVDRAIVCASNEQEAAEFAKTAVWAVEATLAGAAVVGVAGLVKDKAAITNKLQATKINVSSAVKAKFSQKQALRTESSQKITAVIEEKATARANQRKTGNVGTYKELTRGAPKGGFQDGKEANHIPSKAFMKKYGISEDEGLAILMTKKQHAKTRTMRQPPTNNTPRDELTKDLLDVKKILKEDGNYTPDINRDLLKGVKDYQSKHLDIFKKEPKK